MTIAIPTLDELVSEQYTQETVVTADAYPLVVRFFEPDTRAVGSVLIAPAMGVPQRYYLALATWLQRRGFLVATFDYRGMGLSREGPLRKVDADILVWARKDCDAVLDALHRRAPSVPLTWVGHSLGGQILPFVPKRRHVAKIVTIGSGSGYWRENAAPLKRVSWLLWFLIAPVTTPVFGYFPGARLNMVGDLPRGVMDQWRRWCLHPDYVVGVEGAWAKSSFETVTQPITVLSFTDDEFMSAENTESLHQFYTGAAQTHHRINPRAIGLRRIGHFGFFRESMAEALWTPYLLTALATD